MIMEKKYHTFWCRLAASILDSLIVYVPLVFTYFFTEYFFMRKNMNMLGIINMILLIVIIFSRPVYTIWMHGRYGQTLGKKAMNIILLNVEETRIVNYREAVRREYLRLIIVLLYLILQFYPMVNANYFPRTLHTQSIVSYTGWVWLFVEVITMFTNDKRRSLHDLIAGSVVIRKEFMFMEKFPEHSEQFTFEEAA
jgi:uncharacterized RDD family membrane protein YckC